MPRGMAVLDYSRFLMIDLFWVLCYLVHTIFSTKHWQLSRKLCLLMDKEAVKEDYVVAAVFWAQVVLILTTSTLITAMELSGNQKLLRRESLILFLGTTPAFVETIILAIAFFKIN